MSNDKTFPTALAVLLALGLAACGGGGGVDEPAPLTFETLFVPTVASHGGWVSAGGLVDTEDELENGAFVGGGGDFRLKGFLTFQLPAPPMAGATLVSATLKTHQVRVLNSVYDNLGDAKVDHVLVGPELDPSDFDSPSLQEAFGILSVNDVLEQKTLDVTAQVLADLTAGRPASSFRVWFDEPTGVPSGLAEFTKGAGNLDPTGTPAQLELRWQLP